MVKTAITIEQMIESLEEKNGHAFDCEQVEAIEHGIGPLWVIAGPGTGKTEVLVVRALKLICCDDIEPGSIMLTTFTEKAARNIQDRINDSMLFLCSRFEALSNIDIAQLRTGTLHSLCNEILQDYSYYPYQNLKLLDDVESKMLIRKLVASNIKSASRYIQSQFDYLFPMPHPNLWNWTKALQTLYDRVVEYRVDMNLLRQNGGAWAELADAISVYEEVLTTKHACDFARLQRFFLEFLSTEQGDVFIKGDGSPQRPPLLYVLVDEYQDTNPIQEEIYFKLCENSPYNLTVVGDDDQALYRFRGGTVECMVGFGQRCQSSWNVTPHRVTLIRNHRSDQLIVDYCNQYITSFPQMAEEHARVLDKPEIEYGTNRCGTYPVISHIRGNNIEVVADTFASVIDGLISNNIIEDYSQCVLLLKSTRESSRFAEKYSNALRNRGIPIYNPRSKSFLQQPEVQELLGSFINIVDPPNEKASDINQPSIVSLVNDWASSYQSIAPDFPLLSEYIQRSQEAVIESGPDSRIVRSAPSILYRILSHEPFLTYQTEPDRDLRLSKLTRLLEAFCTQNGRAIFACPAGGKVNDRWLNNFYYIFCGYLSTHGLDDDEFEEAVCPVGRVPIMTIHQAKGLEFDFVFVGTLGGSVSPSNNHYLERDLEPFRNPRPLITHSVESSAWHDEIRLHYVAYSRAKYALILMATDSQLRAKTSASFGHQGGRYIRQNFRRL